MAENTKQQLLRKAVALLGRDELARRVNVPVTLLDAWIRGHASMPDRKLVALADILQKISDHK